jgi:DNA invertase Pin-like site-specific DNA recombinase
MKFGYARVSKNDQSLDIQIEKLKKAGCDEIFAEKVSGAKDDRTQLNLLISKLRKGDAICVVRLDRLGRRMSKLIEMINDFKDKNIEFIALENNIDTTTSMGMLLFTMCAAFSEMERILIKERVKAGLDAAHSKGRKGGRPKSLTIEKSKKLQSLVRTKDFS